jgi:hypothetical protein
MPILQNFSDHLLSPRKLFGVGGNREKLKTNPIHHPNGTPFELACTFNSKLVFAKPGRGKTVLLAQIITPAQCPTSKDADAPEHRC